MLLPELVECLQTLVGQFKEADRALCGRRDFSVQLEYVRHRITVNVWWTMTAEQMHRLRAACFCLSKDVTAGLMTYPSTNGNLQVHYKYGAGNKH